ncbi:MAG: GNAT family N-acetyltransferase [Solirubrobacteraceae bacterium MAG38_C4-C5]|nr:GNAT family N-acetyltransferase [Candidatus Siliceabacter maunaloa]
MGLTVRSAVESDAEAVARIYIESWNEGFGDLLGVRFLEDDRVTRWAHHLTTGPQRWWLAERQGSIVGFVGIGPSRDPVERGLGELDTIAVAPTEWGSGIGRRLMSVALDGLAESFSEAILWTVAGYERGHRFYVATGWAADGGTRRGGREVSFRRL